jgi:hypothetical protein
VAEVAIRTPIAVPSGSVMLWNTGRMGDRSQDSETGQTVETGETGRIPISFALVGVQKAATSTIAFYLLRHRHVARGQRKERHFFDKDFLDWAHPDYSQYHSPRRTARQLVAGDYTPAYLFWPQALQRMHRYNPDMKLIASFRDPVERAFSQWQMDYARHEGFPQFAQAILDDTFETVPDRVPEGWQPGELRRRALVTRGLYGAQLERAFDTYPDRSRWLLLDFVDVVTDRDALLDTLTDFLEIGRFVDPPAPQAKNASPVVEAQPPTTDDVLRLVERFAPDLPLFEKLSGIDTARWATSRILAGTLDPAELAEKLGRKAGLLR